MIRVARLLETDGSGPDSSKDMNESALSGAEGDGGDANCVATKFPEELIVFRWLIDRGEQQ